MNQSVNQSFFPGQRGFYPTGAHGIQTGPAFGADGAEIPTELIIEEGELDPIEEPEVDLKAEVEQLKKNASGLQHWLMDGNKDGVVTREEVKTFAMGAAAGFILSRLFFKG